MLCGKVLANASLKPAKLKEHLSPVYHKNPVDGVDSFRSKKTRFKKVGTLPKFGFITTQKPCLKASYKVAYGIAKQTKAHMIGETRMKPRALEMTELACGVEQKKKLKAVALSNAGAYAPGVLGVRRTPCQTEHNVTISRSCDQENITKKLRRLLCTFKLFCSTAGIRKHSRRLFLK